MPAPGDQHDRKTCLQVYNPAGISIEFALVRSSPQRFDCVLSIVRVSTPPQYKKVNRFSVGLFSCALPRVRRGSCGSLRTSPISPRARSGLPSILSRPFVSPASLSWTRPKSAPRMHVYKSIGYARANQAVGCSIGWRRKHCRCVSSVVIDHYRHLATRMHVHGGGLRQETTCQDTVRTTTMGASKVRRDSS